MLIVPDIITSVFHRFLFSEFVRVSSLMMKNKFPTG